MDATTIRRFAVGAFASPEALGDLGIEPAPVQVAGDDWTSAPHAYLVAKGAVWLYTHDTAVRDRAIAKLGDEHTVVTIDCWNAFSESSVVARFRIERHRSGTIEVSHADRRHSDLARAGILPDVAAGWLVQKVRGLASTREATGPTKKDLQQVERAQQFLAALLVDDTVPLTPGSTAADLLDRTRRILFVIAKSRADAVNGIVRMLGDSKHVARPAAGLDTATLAKAVRAALDAVKYRK